MAGVRGAGHLPRDMKWPLTGGQEPKRVRGVTISCGGILHAAHGASRGRNRP
jgi:hypothetical protein